MTKATESVIEESGELGEEDLRRSFGVRVMKLRESKGWSRGELAVKLGVSRCRLGNWERGVNSPPLKRLVDLGRCLRVSLDELIAGDAPLAGPLSGESGAVAASGGPGKPAGDLRETR